MPKKIHINNIIKVFVLAFILGIVMNFNCVNATNIIDATNKSGTSVINNQIKKSLTIQSYLNSTISAFSNSNNTNYEGQLIAKNGWTDLCIERSGKHYLYQCSDTTRYILIKKYCVETNTQEQVLNLTDNISEVYNHYVKGSKIYFIVAKTNSEYLNFYEFDTATDTIIHNVELPFTSEEYCDALCVDGKNNIYFVINTENEDERALISCTYNGDFIDGIVLNLVEYTKINIVTTDKDSKNLMLCMNTNNGLYAWWDDFTLKINNGFFVDKSLYRTRQYGGMIFKFLNEDRTYALTQNGEFIQIEYSPEYESGLVYIPVGQLKPNNDIYYISYDFTDDNKFEKEGSYLYLGGKSGIIYIYNFENNRIKRSLNIGQDKVITGVYKTGNTLYVEYYPSSQQYFSSKTYYMLTIDLNELYGQEEPEITINNHSTQKHSQHEIKSKYEAAEVVCKVDNNSIYVEKPSSKYPYKAGSLIPQVIQDTLNQENYFRWLAGLNSVTLNEEYMSWSQRGAVVLAAVDVLTHWPDRPAKMDDDFYSKGYASTSAGFGFSANVSKGTLVSYSVKGYIDDVYNIEPNVGHRLSLLDVFADEISLGYAYPYGSINVFSDYATDSTDKYTAWPSAGFFPVQSIDPNAMWSISFANSGLDITEDVYVVIRANGREYTYSESDTNNLLEYEYAYQAFFYKLPNEVKQYLTDGTYDIKENKKVEVEVHGLADSSGKKYVVKYPVKFFSVDNIVALQGDLDRDGSVNADDAAVALDLYKYNNATAEDLAIGDMDGDGAINADDAALILDIYKYGF